MAEAWRNSDRACVSSFRFCMREVLLLTDVFLPSPAEVVSSKLTNVPCGLECLSKCDLRTNVQYDRFEAPIHARVTTMTSPTSSCSNGSIHGRKSLQDARRTQRGVVAMIVRGHQVGIGVNVAGRNTHCAPEVRRRPSGADVR